jgi:enhancing lycopene biosynthesis protein 2
MAKRVGVVLSGCGFRDGTEIGEALVTMLALERAGAQVIAAAPDQAQTVLINHRSGDVVNAKPKRNVMVEASRLTRTPLVSLADLNERELDALILPGGDGVAQALSTYADKGELCEVHPDVARLLRAMLSSHKPIGLIGLAPILAARILGPVAGVRVTLGARGSLPAKHAAVMGADVRPCPVDDIVIDQKSRVVSAPASMYEDARLGEVATGIEKLVRSVLSMAQDRAPRVPGPASSPASSSTSSPSSTSPAARGGEATGRARGSV